MIPNWLKYTLLFALLSHGCGNSPDKAGTLVMENVKNDETCRDIYVLANSRLQLWLSKKLEEVQVLNECAWRLDSMVVLNTTKDRAILLLTIQDKHPKAELDYVYIMYAARNKSEWEIYFSGLPNIVYQRGKYAAGQPISLNELSELSRAYIIANYFDSQGKVLNERVNKFYTADLISKNKKFLEK